MEIRVNKNRTKIIVAVFVVCVIAIVAVAVNKTGRDKSGNGEADQLQTAQTTAEPQQTEASSGSAVRAEADKIPVKEIYQDYFLVGAAINGSDVDTAAINHEGMSEILKEHFNSTTLSNLMKPDYLLDQKASKCAGIH